jgi:aspartate carbamoyltransferase catalytic subunit
MRHLLSIDDLDAAEIEDLLDLADGFVEVLARDVPKVPTLRGKTIALLFYENSTRTRLSFDRAAKALSADVLTFTPGGSSVSKGREPQGHRPDAEGDGAGLMVVRHGDRGTLAGGRVDRPAGHQRR